MDRHEYVKAGCGDCRGFAKPRLGARKTSSLPWDTRAEQGGRRQLSTNSLCCRVGASTRSKTLFILGPSPVPGLPWNLGTQPPLPHLRWLCQPRAGHLPELGPLILMFEGKKWGKGRREEPRHGKVKCLRQGEMAHEWWSWHLSTGAPVFYTSTKTSRPPCCLRDHTASVKCVEICRHFP